MKYIFTILAFFFCLKASIAQSGEGFDFTNVDNPEQYGFVKMDTVYYETGGGLRSLRPCICTGQMQGGAFLITYCYMRFFYRFLCTDDNNIGKIAENKIYYRKINSSGPFYSKDFSYDPDRNHFIVEIPSEISKYPGCEFYGYLKDNICGGETFM